MPVRSAPLAVSLAFALAACRRAAPVEPTRVVPAVPRVASLGATPRVVAWTGQVRVENVRFTVHVPDGFDPALPLDLVVFFHGAALCGAEFVFNGAMDDANCPGHRHGLVGAGGAGRLDATRARAVLLVPQLDGESTRLFAHENHFREMLDALLRGPLAAHTGGAHTYAQVERVVLAAHSLGNRTLDHVLANGGIEREVDTVALFDGVMDGVALYERWLERARPDRPRRILSVYGGVPAARRDSLLLAREWAHSHPGSVDTRGAPVTDSLRTHTVTLHRSHYDHGWIPLVYFTKAMDAAGLPERVRSPGEHEAHEVMVAPVSSTVVHPGEHRAGTLDETDGRLFDGARADDYPLALAAGETVEIRATGGQATYDPTPLDTRLHVLLDGRVLAVDDDGGASLPGAADRFDSRIEFRAPVGATFTIRVSTYGSGDHRGTYELAVIRR